MCHKGQVPDGSDFDRTDISDEVIEAVKPVYPFLKHAILFGDGEPLVYRGFWDIVKDIRQASSDCLIDFIQNGTLMNDRNIDNILNYEIDVLGLSLGGSSSKSHDYIRKGSSFNETINSFKQLKQAKEQRKVYYPYINALIVVMKTNYKEIPEFVNMCHELGLWRLCLQQLFITHPSMNKEYVSSDEIEPYVKQAGKLAKEKRILFSHYPLVSGANYNNDTEFGKHNSKDRIFRQQESLEHNNGYCKAMQPWNTVYVLHNGDVVPDCHWWTSIRETNINTCGRLSKTNNILNIWNGPQYAEIRDRILKNQYLPQCRGCGLAGGVVDKHVSPQLVHVSPNQERVVHLRSVIKQNF